MQAVVVTIGLIAIIGVLIAAAAGKRHRRMTSAEARSLRSREFAAGLVGSYRKN